MRKITTAFALFLTLLTAIGFAQDADPMLPTAEPLRRLGDSEFRLPLRSNERMFQFSPDGTLLAACNWNEVRIWTFPDGKLKHDFSAVIDSELSKSADDAAAWGALSRQASW